MRSLQQKLNYVRRRGSRANYHRDISLTAGRQKQVVFAVVGVVARAVGDVARVVGVVGVVRSVAQRRHR